MIHHRVDDVLGFAIRAGAGRCGVTQRDYWVLDDLMALPRRRSWSAGSRASPNHGAGPTRWRSLNGESGERNSCDGMPLQGILQQLCRSCGNLFIALPIRTAGSAMPHPEPPHAIGLPAMTAADAADVGGDNRRWRLECRLSSQILWVGGIEDGKAGSPIFAIIDRRVLHALVPTGFGAPRCPSFLATKKGLLPSCGR